MFLLKNKVEKSCNWDRGNSKCGRTSSSQHLVRLVSMPRFYPKTILPTIIIPHGQNFTEKTVNSLSSLLFFTSFPRRNTRLFKLLVKLNRFPSSGQNPAPPECVFFPDRGLPSWLPVPCRDWIPFLLPLHAWHFLG